MRTPWYDTPGVHLVLHVLARAEGPVTLDWLSRTTGLGSQTIKSKVGGVRRRIRDVPGAALVRVGRYPDSTVELVGLTPSDVEVLVGPSPLTCYSYLGFTRSQAVLVRTLVEAEGRTIEALTLARVAYPGSPGRAEGLGRIRATVSLVAAARLAAGETTGPVRRDDEGSEGYLWGTLSEATHSETALETTVVRVSLPSVAGAYVFAGGRLYRDGCHCAATTDRV